MVNHYHWTLSDTEDGKTTDDDTDNDKSENGKYLSTYDVDALSRYTQIRFLRSSKSYIKKETTTHTIVTSIHHYMCIHV